MATRFAARSMEEHQRSRESAGGNAEARHKATLAPLQGGGIGSRRESGAVTRLQLYNQIAVKTGPNSHVSIGSVRLADQNVTALIGIQATDDVGVAADAVAEIPWLLMRSPKSYPSTFWGVGTAESNEAPGQNSNFAWVNAPSAKTHSTKHGGVDTKHGGVEKPIQQAGNAGDLVAGRAAYRRQDRRRYRTWKSIHCCAWRGFADCRSVTTVCK
ncbi:hypothetical protein SBA3_2780022 [Candidatus Sulfopaludibacter sp. SbA3]|nr:hypothetical protein SBA3_2780022 [Candidatus Sulfopaludibacter sp. SbA3]